MTTKQYMDDFFKIYSLVSVLSDKNDCKVIRARNKELKKDIILRSYPNHVPAYEWLYNIQCENLPIIYDVICLEDGQIVLEEFIDGITIANVIENGKYRYSGMSRVIKQVCNALNLLHSENLVHRDVKPENVMITQEGRVVLIDFNTSRRMSVAGKDTVIMGTVGYASPEQLGIAQSDTRTDVYAVGVMINVMLTGKHPSEKLAKGKAGKMVLKCTNINPDKRYQTIEELSGKL
ncbi:MAG: serine/threonine protein kinase [Ruminococcaceae bacterium]|nr:serine/threonine protein kinase [Oscillospiraceae bacterium]